MEEFTPNKSKMKAVKGQYLTQSLFVEIGYDYDTAIYSLKDEDMVHEGKTYPSIKRLYLEAEDVTEYIFATKYFINWEHWERICKNGLLAPHVQRWREDLARYLEAIGIQEVINAATTDNNFQAAKWLAEKGWTKEQRKAGRPSKTEVDRHIKEAQNQQDEYAEDFEKVELKVIGE